MTGESPRVVPTLNEHEARWGLDCRSRVSGPNIEGA
jgi:hypothetical protein